MLLGVFAVAAPFLPGKLAFAVLGALILAFGLLQNYTGFGLANESAAFSWFSRGGASILTGLLLLAMPKLTFAGLAILFGLSWIISGISEAVSAVRRRNDDDAIWSMIDGVISVLLGVMIAIQKPVEGIVSVGLFVGLRCFSAGWSILTSATAPAVAADAAASTHPDVRLGLPPHPYFEAVRTDLAREEMIRSRNDRGWCWLFLFTFFAIHVCRMDVDWTFVGLLSPAGAVVGDAMLAVVVAFGLVAPISDHLARLNDHLGTTCMELAACNDGSQRRLSLEVETDSLVAVVPTSFGRQAKPNAGFSDRRGRLGFEDGTSSRGYSDGDDPAVGRQLVFQHRNLGRRHLGSLRRGSH